MGAEICCVMKSKEVVLIDYGMGNLWSVSNAIAYLGYTPIISDDPEKICKANILLLPGVGSFRMAMDSLRKSGIDQAIVEAVKCKGVKILGICLGMQLMGLSSTEDGLTAGLGLIPSSVDKFNISDVGARKIPHIGFDSVVYQPKSILFGGLQSSPDFYFVHSYYFLPSNLYGLTAVCNYGVDFLAAYEQDNIFATQFHPEKSQTNGLILLKNFLAK